MVTPPRWKGGITNDKKYFSENKTHGAGRCPTSCGRILQHSSCPARRKRVYCPYRCGESRCVGGVITCAGAKELQLLCTAVFFTFWIYHSIYGSTYQAGILHKYTVAYILIIAISPESGSRGILRCIAIELEHYGTNRRPAPGAGQMLTTCSGRWITVSPRERQKAHSLLTIHAHEPRL